MAQVVDVNDIDQAPGSNNKQDNNNNKDNQSSSSNANSAQPSAFMKGMNKFKTSTISASKSAAQVSKQRLSMEGQLKQARISLERYVNPKVLNKQINEDTLIPKWVLKRAKGLVFLSVIKAGFLFAGNVGTGCVIVRQSNGGWSGPSSVGVAGVSFGFLAGASKVDYIMILPDDKAVQQFTGKGQLRLGGEIQLAVGPIGRDGSGSVGAGDKGVSVVYSYSHAQGLYGGLALDGKVISVRPDCNRSYYKQSIECFDILSGKVNETDIPSNEDYDMIIHLLDSYCLDDDMTPIKGEKLTIDDLNNSDKQQQNDDQKKSENDKEEKVSMARKVSTGFNKFTSSVSEKILSSFSASDKYVEYEPKKKKQEVALQKEQSKQQNNAKIDANKFSIGADDDSLNVPDYGSD